jgi:hypothetical protein
MARKTLERRNDTHEEFLVKWANFVKTHPNEWKREHTQFINAQIEMANAFYERLVKTPGGKEKIIELRSIKNKRMIDSLLAK